MAGSNVYDQIINGTFSSLNPSVAEMYAGIYPQSASPSYQPGMMGRGMPLNASNRLPRSTAGIDPIGWAPPAAPAWNTPTAIDLAAIDKWNASLSGDTGSMLAMFPDKPATPAVAAATSVGNPVTSVTGRMQPTSRGGGLAELLFGPSKNGMGGLAGLLGLLGNNQRRPPIKLPGSTMTNGSGANSAGVNKNGNWYNTETSQWNYSDPSRSGFTPISNNQSLS